MAIFSLQLDSVKIGRASTLPNFDWRNLGRLAYSLGDSSLLWAGVPSRPRYASGMTIPLPNLVLKRHHRQMTDVLSLFVPFLSVNCRL